MIASAFDAIAPFCGRIIVVVGDDPGAIAAALAPRPYEPVAGAPDADMFTSTQGGLAAAIAGPDGAPPWIILHPADHPTVAAATIAALMERASMDPSIAALMPEHGGRGGHPVVIAAHAVAAILAWRGEGGLAGFWRSGSAPVIRLPVGDPGVVVDLDTREEYRRAARGP